MKSIPKFMMSLAVIPLTLYPTVTWSGSGSSRPKPRLAVLSELMQPTKTMGEFYDRLEKHVHPLQKEFFLSQVSRYQKIHKINWRTQKMPIVLTKIEGKKLHFRDQSSSQNVLFEIIGTKEIFARINNVNISHQEFESPKSLWEKMQLAVNNAPDKKATALNLWNLLVPQAHAFGLMGLLALGGLAFGGYYLWNHWGDRYGDDDHHHHHHRHHSRHGNYGRRYYSDHYSRY